MSDVEVRVGRPSHEQVRAQLVIEMALAIGIRPSVLHEQLVAHSELFVRPEPRFPCSGEGDQFIRVDHYRNGQQSMHFHIAKPKPPGHWNTEPAT